MSMFHPVFRSRRSEAYQIATFVTQMLVPAKVRLVGYGAPGNLPRIISYGLLVVGCLSCRQEFVYANINDDRLADFVNPNKPEMPSGGNEAGCPNCGHLGVYNRTDLFYRK